MPSISDFNDVLLVVAVEQSLGICTLPVVESAPFSFKFAPLPVVDCCLEVCASLPWLVRSLPYNAP